MNKTHGIHRNEQGAVRGPVTLALLLGGLLAAPMAAQTGEDEFTIHDGMVIGKSIEEGHVILDLFGTSGDGFLQVLCPLAQTRDLLEETCKMCEFGDTAPLWNGLAPDPESSSFTLHRLTSVTIGQHEDQFVLYQGQVTGKRIEGGHVILALLGSSEESILEVLCPLNQPEVLLAETCDMIEIGDVAYLWDGLAPDPMSDFPTLHRLTSVTIGISVIPEIFVDGFESGNMLVWSPSS